MYLIIQITLNFSHSMSGLHHSFLKDLIQFIIQFFNNLNDEEKILGSQSEVEPSDAK